jgi:hypothetical protein
MDVEIEGLGGRGLVLGWCPSRPDSIGCDDEPPGPGADELMLILGVAVYH